MPLPVLVLRAVRISNDLYRSAVVSSVEAPKGFKSLVLPESYFTHEDPELLEGHANLTARGKITRIFFLTLCLKPDSFLLNSSKHSSSEETKNGGVFLCNSSLISH